MTAQAEVAYRTMVVSWPPTRPASKPSAASKAMAVGAAASNGTRL